MLGCRPTERIWGTGDHFRQTAFHENGQYRFVPGHVAEWRSALVAVGGSALPEGAGSAFRVPTRPPHDAPLIGERAVTRGRVATEGGDEPPGEPNSLPLSAFSHLRFMQHYAPEATTHGRSGTEGGDEPAGVERALSVRAPARGHTRPTTRPGRVRSPVHSVRLRRRQRRATHRRKRRNARAHRKHATRDVHARRQSSDPHCRRAG